MPKYYYLDFSKFDAVPNTSSYLKNRHFARHLVQLIGLMLIGTLFISSMKQIIQDNKTEALKLSFLNSFLMVGMLLINILMPNPYCIRTFKQKNLNHSDRKAIHAAYKILQKNYPNFLANFMEIEGLITIEDFIGYCQAFSQKGLCAGYTYEGLRQIALHPNLKPSSLLNQLEMKKVIEHQLIEHIRVSLIRYHIPEGIHICFPPCPGHQAVDILGKSRNQLPKMIAINTLYGTIESPRIFDGQKLKDFFTTHLQGLGFVPSRKFNLRGQSHPIDEISNRCVITAKEVEEKLQLEKESHCNRQAHATDRIFSMFQSMKKEHELRQRKMEYLHKHRRAINLNKYMIAGHISIKKNGGESGHAMLYKIAKQHILFFDSNHGLYQYPSSKTFCQELASHLANQYSDTDYLSLKTFLFKI